MKRYIYLSKEFTEVLLADDLGLAVGKVFKMIKRVAPENQAYAVDDFYALFSKNITALYGCPTTLEDAKKIADARVRRDAIANALEKRIYK